MAVMDEAAETGGTSEQVGADLDVARGAAREAVERAVAAGGLSETDSVTVTAQLYELGDVHQLHRWALDHTVLRCHVCRYPGCFRPRRPSTGAGRPPEYCDLRDGKGRLAHTAAKSLRRRLDLEKPSAGERTEAGDAGVDHPASSARASIPQLVADVTRLVAEHQAEQGRRLDQLLQAVGTLGDAEAQVAEVDNVQQDAAERIQEMTEEKLTALQSAGQAKEIARRARENEHEAVVAAEELAEQLQAVEQDAGERIAAAEEGARAQAAVDQGRVEAAEAAAAGAATALEHAQVEFDAGIQRAEQEVTAATEALREVEGERDRLVGALEYEQRLVEEGKVALAKAGEAHEQALDRAGREHKEAMAALRTDHQAVVTRLGEDLDREREEITRLRGALQAAEDRHGAELTAARTEARAEADARVNELRGAMEADLERERAEVTRLRQAMQAAEDRHGEDLAKVRADARAEADARVNELRAAMEAGLAARGGTEKR